MPAELSDVTDPAFVADLAEIDLVELRRRRDASQALENALSYVRRLLHGRLDIVRDELERRRTGAAPSDLEDIIGRLPELLADGSRGTASPRPPQDLEPGAEAEAFVAELEARFPASLIGSLPELDDNALVALADDLASYERQISGGRNELHGVIDALHGEIIGRYQTGDASVDSLLG